MDKQLLNALDNLSEALVMIADALGKKGSSNTTTTNVLQSGDFSKQLKAIDAGIKSIKSDTKEILKNQKTILELSKSKSKSPMEDIGGDKKAENDIKKGVGTILMIAVAVLAIGLAFKLVGNIDFLSVIGLSLAIVLMSVAFEKIAKLDLPMDKVKIAAGAMVIMAMAITISSWVLKLVIPISFGQAITSILIAGMFSVIAFGLKNLINSLDDIGAANLVKSILWLPLILPAMALAITISSWVLTFVIPVSFTQALTAILIAGMFSVMAYGLEKIVTATGKIKNIGTILLLPLILPMMALAITMSSLVLQFVMPISPWQAVTAILIGALFVVLSYGIAKIAEGVSKMEWSSITKIPAFFFLMSTAIAASAMVFSLSEKYFHLKFETLMNAIIIGLTMSIVTLIISYAVKNLGDLTLPKVVLIPVLFSLLSLAIAVSAVIFSNYQKEIDSISDSVFTILKFSIILALSIAVMSIAFWLVNKLGTRKQYAMGAMSILVIAGAIALSSHILALGDYSGAYPGWEWSLSVGLSLLIFGLATVALGLVMESGIGAGALALGAVAVLGVAAVIVGASMILSKGTYGKYPDLDWSKGVGLSLLTFGVSMVILGSFITATLGVGVIALAAGGRAVLMVAQSIVDVSKKLTEGTYKGGPTKEWAEGVGVAIGAFAPVYAMLMNKGVVGLLTGGPTPEEFKSAILTVTSGIITSALVFSKYKGAFKNGPSEEWSKGVAIVIGAFAPVVKLMSEQSWGEDAAQSIYRGITFTAQAIVRVAHIFQKNKAWGTPPKGWTANVKTSISGFMGIIKSLSGISILGKSAVSSIARKMVETATILHEGHAMFSKPINPNYMKNLSSNIVGFANLAKKITEVNKGSSTMKSLLGQDPMSQTANSMVKLANAYDRLAISLKSFGDALQSIDGDKVNVIRRLTGNLAVLASMNEQAFAGMMSTLEEKSSVFSKLLDSSGDNSPTVGVSKHKKSSTLEPSMKQSKYGTTSQQLDLLIELMIHVNKSTSSVDEYIATKGVYDHDRPIDLNMK